MEPATKLEGTRQRLEATDADMSGSTFTDVNLSGATIQNANLAQLRISNADLRGVSIVESQTDGMTINGILVADLLAAYRAARSETA